MTTMPKPVEVNFKKQDPVFYAGDDLHAIKLRPRKALREAFRV